MGSFSGGSTGVTINSSEPVSPNSGELWINNSTDNVYVRNSSNDGWVTILKNPLTDNIISSNSESISDFSIPSSAVASSVAGSGSTTSTSGGTGFIGGMSSGRCYWVKHTGVNNKTIEKVGVYVGTASGGLKVALYSDSGSPNELLTSTASYTTVSSGWNDITLDSPYTMTSNTVWVAFIPDNSTITVYFSKSSTQYNKGTSGVFESPVSGAIGNDAQYYTRTIEINAAASKAIDDNTTTFFMSSPETNPHVYVDLGSSLKSGQIACYANSNTTETQILIQTSSDAIAWTTQRTITVSNLTNGAWNFIRFPVIDCRYIRIYGNSGLSKILAFNQIKVRTLSDSDLTLGHSHLEISTSDTTLALNGS